MSKRFIALDWGTTSFRAYLADDVGNVLEQASSPQGILSVKDGDFDSVFEAALAPFDQTLPIMASGMITSRQGWVEVPYANCPAGIDELTSGVVRHVARSGRVVHFVPGLCCRAGAGIPDVMRGEETQVFGSLRDADGCFVTPGTHSKWIVVRGGKITHFATYMTGEVFAVLSKHSILGRLMSGNQHDDEAFSRGVRNALDDPAGLLHRIFSARTLPLFEMMKESSVSSYLSGQVIGTEVAHAMVLSSHGNDHIVLGSDGLAARYVEALQIAGLRAKVGDVTASVKGLARIASAAGVFA